MPYSCILLATDLTDSSKLSESRASVLAAKFKATFHLLHVVEVTPMVYAGEFSIAVDETLEQDAEKSAKRALTKLGTLLKVPKKNQHILSGEVQHCILTLSEKLNVDLIVLGSHQEKGLESLFGSHAHAILRNSICDVLAVRTD